MALIDYSDGEDNKRIVENATEGIFQFSEEKYRALVERLPGAVFLDTPDSLQKPFYISPRIEDILGYTQEEWISKVSWEDIIHPEDRDRILSVSKHSDLTGEAFRESYRIRNKSGDYVWIREETSLVKDEHEKPLFWQGFFLDISDQVKVQRESQENEEKYRQLFESESDAIFLIDNESGKILEANVAATVMYGYSKEELLQKRNSDLSAEPEQTRRVTQTTPAIKDRLITIPLRFHRKKDGTVFPVEITGRFFEWRGRPVHIAAIRDITERRSVEEALHESEQNFRNIIEHTTNIYYSHTPDHILTFMSHQTREILGYEPAEVLINWHELLTDNPVNQEGIELTQKAIDTGQRQTPYILELKRKDGQNVWVEIHESPILQDGQTVAMVGTLTDITERKRAEDLLRRQLDELTILHNIALAASSSKSLDELIKRTTDTIYEALLPANCGVELVSDRENTYFAHSSYRGTKNHEVRKPAPITSGITGKVISTGMPVRLGDVSQDPDYLEATKGVRSELCVPIKIQDRIIGAFNIESKKVDAYNESDERLLNTVAGTLASAIEQLRLYETSQQRLNELTILNKVSQASTDATSVDQLIEKITAIIGESLYPDNFGVLLLNANNTKLSPHPSYRGISLGRFPTSFSLDKGVCGQVAASGKALRIANVRSYKNYIEVTPQVRSELCVPIANGDRILGVINAESLIINMFTENDERLLATIASTLATAIEKLRLLEAEKTRRQKAETLLQATTTLTTSLNLDTLLDTILEIISKIVPYDSASIAVEQEGKLLIVAGRGFPAEYKPVGKQLLFSEKWRQLSTTHKPLILPDAQVDPTFEHWQGSEYIRGWMGVPLIVHGTLKGFINLDSRKPDSFTENDAILAQTFANSAAVAIENARLFEVEQHSRQKADALREATAALTASMELESLYQTILDSLAKLIPFDSASIEILQQGMVKVVAGKGLRDNKNRIGQQYRFDTAKWGNTATSRIPIVIPDVQADDRFIKFEGTSYIRSWMSVPMLIQDKQVGFLNLDSTIIDFFTTDHAALAQTFGNQAAIAIENARLFQEESRRSQIIESMANIANEFATAQEIIPALDKITQRALELLHASTVAIYLLQDDDQTLKVVTAQGTYREQLMSHTIQVGMGITGNIIKTGKPEIVDDMFKDARRVTVPGTPEEDAQRDTIMSAPLILRGKTIGTINAWRKRSSGLFDESELNFLVAIANQTSVSIESIRLFQETARHAQEAHAIAGVGRDISSTLQFDNVLERIAQYAKDLLRAETSAVYLINPEEVLLQAIAVVGTDANEIKDYPLPLGRGILGSIALQKSGEIVNHTLKDPRAITIKGTQTDPNEHLMGVPVLSKDRLTGLLAVWRTGEGEAFKPHELDFLSSLAQQAAVAIENARLFEAEQKRRREAEILRQAFAALTSSLELEEVLNTLLDQIAILIRFNSAAVFLREKDHYKVVAGKGFKQPEKVIGKRFPFDDELASIVRETGQAIVSSDIQKDTRFQKWGDSEDIHGWMCFPLKVRGVVIGHLTIDSYEIDAYNEADAELAMAFANQAAFAIQNARQFEAEQRHFQEAETLRQAAEAITSSLNIQQVLDSILENLNRVVPFDSAGVFLIENDQVRLTAYKGAPDKGSISGQLFPADNALFCEILNSGRPLILEDAQIDSRFQKWVIDGTRGWMGVPLIARGTIIGYITIDSLNTEAYKEHDAILAMTFAHQAAAAIENARLYERSEQQIRQLTVLRDIDSAISSSFDLRITLNLLIGYAAHELNADAVAILLYNPDLKSLYIYTSTGLINRQTSTASHIRIGEGLAGHVVLQRKLVHIANLANTSEFQPAPYISGEQFASYFGVPLISKGQIKGVMEIYTRKESNPDSDWFNFLQTLAGQAAIAIDNVHLFKNLQRTNQELTLAYDTTLAGWGRALELRDKETQGHTDRVVELTLELARCMGIRGEELTNILRGTLLHDIGKMGIPDTILHKPGPLTEEEWAIMQQHPKYAFDLMNPIPYLRQALDIPYAHHERWDGSGYPRGLKGEEIPLAARIFAVVDVWDALSNNRVYRDAWPEDRVIAYLKSTAGIELDPKIVEKFLELLEEKKQEENQAD